MIEAIDLVLDVSEAQRQLQKPGVWNRQDARREQYAHKAVDDIWVRYNDWSNFNGDLAAFNQPHESAWYPVVCEIPAVWSLVRKLFRHVNGKKLGGVLITRIRPGGKVEPHIDGGWHAGYYEKFAVQIKGDANQAFCFDGIEHSANDGECYTFRNDMTHWVRNDSDRERITLIVCIKR